MRATHTLVLDSRPYWNALWGAPLQAQLAGKIIPDGTDPKVWTQNVAVDDYPHQGKTMDYWVSGLLDADPNATVMIDELSAGHLDQVKEFAMRMPPRHDGRWGVYLVNGPHVHYKNLEPALGLCIERDATFGLEFYYEYMRKNYLRIQSGFGTKAADDWLRGHFHQGRLSYLNAACRERGKEVKAFPMFGVTDKFAGVHRAIQWLDRCMYCWNTGSGLARRLSMEHGIGTWVWDGERISTTARDTALLDSIVYYQAGRTSSLKGRYYG